MAKSKPTRPLSPLPVRDCHALHANLVIAIIIAIAVAAGMAPSGVNLPARVLTGWDVGIAVYLVLTFSIDVARNVAVSAGVRRSRMKALSFILLLSIVAPRSPA